MIIKAKIKKRKITLMLLTLIFMGIISIIETTTKEDISLS